MTSTKPNLLGLWDGAGRCPGVMPLRRGRLGRVERLLEGAGDWGAEQLDGSGLDGGGGGEPLDALSGEDDDLAGEGGQVGEQVLIAGDGQAARGVLGGVFGLGLV